MAAAVIPAVAEATKYGPLADSAVDSTGVGSVVNALGSRWHVDFRTALVTSVVLILLISSVALRSIRAGMTVAATTLAGFVSGLGTCVFVWSHLLGAQISWTAPLISLIIVAAVGGDDAFRLTARALPRPRAKAERGVSYYGGAAPAFATVLIWAAAVFIWVTAVAGSTAVLTLSTRSDRRYRRLFTGPQLRRLPGTVDRCGVLAGDAEPATRFVPDTRPSRRQQRTAAVLITEPAC